MIATQNEFSASQLDLPSQIETERLILRKPQLADAKSLAELANDRTVAEMTTRIPYPYDLQDAVQYLQQVTSSTDTSKSRFAITLKDHGSKNLSEFIGSIGLEMSDGNVSLGYWLGRPYRRNGYTSEAACAVLTALFDTGKVMQVVSAARQINDASKALLDKLGFELSGTDLVRSRSLNGRVPVDTYHLTLERFVQKMANS